MEPVAVEGDTTDIESEGESGDDTFLQNGLTDTPAFKRYRDALPSPGVLHCSDSMEPQHFQSYRGAAVPPLTPATSILTNPRTPLLGARTEELRREKLLNDPVHGHITLHPACVEIIDTPHFQVRFNPKRHS